MKKVVYGITLSLFVFLVCTHGFAAEEDLKATIQPMIDTFNKVFHDEDLDKMMEFFHPDYSFALANLDKEKMRKRFEDLFKNFDDLSDTITIQNVERAGRYIVLTTEEDIKGRSVKEKGAAIKSITKNTVTDLLLEKDGEWLFYLSVVINPKGLANIHGNEYRNDNIGISFSVPKGWLLLPASHPSMLEILLFMPPQGKGSGIYGYIELPYKATPKQAVEGDENILRKIAKDTYKEITAKEVTFKGFPGYESISEFAIDDKPAQKRWRLYFSAGGLLHVFTLDAVPATEWDSLKDDFQGIVDSFTLKPGSEKNASQLARQEHASGSIVGDVYMNNEVGCQVAAPQGWSIESTNLGGGALFSVNIKPSDKTNSLVRLIAWPFTAPIKVEKLIDQQVDSYKMVGKDVITSPSQPITIGDLKGYSTITEFTIEGFDRFKRNTVMFIAKDKLFAFFCDAIPPADFEKLEPKFDEIIQSFSLN